MKESVGVWTNMQMGRLKKKAEYMEECCLRFRKGCSLNTVFFPSDVVIFLNSASSVAALTGLLPAI